MSLLEGITFHSRPILEDISTQIKPLHYSKAIQGRTWQVISTLEGIPSHSNAIHISKADHNKACQSKPLPEGTADHFKAKHFSFLLPFNLKFISAFSHATLTTKSMNLSIFKNLLNNFRCDLFILQKFQMKSYNCFFDILNCL